MILDRRAFLKTILAGGAASVLPAAAFHACSQANKPPNIVLFLADDLGYGDLGCYGNPINRTPHMDRLAAEGVRFTDFHAAGTVCSPARAGLLTGRHPYRLGFYYILGGGAHLRREEITVATLLRTAGYDTCFVGKWHLTNLDRPELRQPTPADHGFNHWFGTSVNAFEGPHNPKKFIRNGEKVGEVDGWYCDVIVDEAVSWLTDRRDHEKPFFLYACSHEPHTPLAPPESYSELYRTADVERLEKGIRYGRVPRRTDKDISGNKAFYYGTVTQLDNAFGRLMKALDDLDLRGDTLVILTSDNGPEYPVVPLESKNEWDDPIRDNCFGTPGPLRGMKRFTYEGGHRVPGIVRWPGRAPAGRVSDALINGTDWLPTFCALAGVDVPSDRTIDGRNVMPALEGEDWTRDAPLFWNFPVHEYAFIPPMAMRQGDYVLLGWFEGKPSEQLWMDWLKTAGPVRYELYDLKQDIEQARDLAGEKPGRVNRMAEAMNRYWKELQADMPVWPEWKAR